MLAARMRGPGTAPALILSRRMTSTGMGRIDPAEYAGRPDAVAAITARYTAALERLVRGHPGQYFWLHRRWKHQPAARKGRKAA